jgi:hypothetical protein
MEGRINRTDVSPASVGLMVSIDASASGKLSQPEELM